VEALYKGRGTKWHAGKVDRVVRGVGSASATYDVAYNDGDRERGALERNVRALDGGGDDDDDVIGDNRSARSRRGGSTSKFRMGQRVEALYKGRGTKWHAGKVDRVVRGVGSASATYDVAYDDGDRERGALERNVRALDGGGRSGDDDSDVVGRG